ncbi:Uncharacterized protein ESCO_005670 [Escovopsis weberi]|uniref:UspA domain-containing protein n=1 Tax=Escovopsis weberi TaxID=150374 RepID=A0A0M8MUT9_ESCWE|nr:Uncharacterized protein ESCO_005670 [Escovopsis weberi]
MAQKKSLPMSIDAMLDMERQEVMALLESKSQGASSSSQQHMRSSSPYMPRSPVRSLVDIAEDEQDAAAPSRHGRSGQTTQAPVRSMLDIDSPLPSVSGITGASVRSMLNNEPSGMSTPGTSTPRTGRRSTPSSPHLGSEPFFRQASPMAPYPRSRSDAGLPRTDYTSRTSGLRNDPMSGYQFSGILPSNPTPQRAKWFPSSSASSSKAGPSSAGAQRGDARGNPDLGGLQLPDRGRNLLISSRLGGSNHQSKSPASRRWGSRSQSPATFAPAPAPHLMLDGGQMVDMNSAYRRLSDANLAFSSGSLAQLPMRKRSEEVGEGRLVKDYLGPDGEHLDSSEDDEPFSSDDEDRGRRKDPRTSDTELLENIQQAGTARKERKTLSLLAAAEEERSQIAQSAQSQYQYRSLFSEPEIKVTTAMGDTAAKPSKSKSGVHPATSYDQGPTSANPSVIDSDEEAEMDDIKRAQKLAFSMTNILDTAEAHRAIRIIYRGEYNKIVQSAEEENHRLRKYLVATDLSDESAHALEWAIGTLLRDGDTLIAIYCVDEETGITGEGLVVPDDSKAMKEQAAAINTISNTKLALAQVTPVTEFKRPKPQYKSYAGSLVNTPAASPARPPNGLGDSSRAEQERHRAVQFITDKVLRLLRKTRLQVRVIVEVLHCKNPKHLVTEVIDLVNPTLVVIGSRGRSALKGVILGSFSNYLVTKSSVPVMVARKRLRKQSKYKRTAVRQVNNLSNPTVRSLANAIVD